MQLLFDYPWYYIFLCLLAGTLYSAVLYWHSKGKGDDALPSWARIAMPALRFVSVSLIALLLMAPLVKRQVNTDERPIIVLAQDISESVGSQSSLLTEADLGKLEKKYEVVTDSFGGKTTDIATALRDINDRYAGRNLGAIVLASDGIYNQGQNPVNLVDQIAVPIYTVALGDTTHYRDAAVTEVRYNRMAYLGNQFPIEITVQAHQMQGEHATLSISRNGQRLYSKEINYSTSRHVQSESVTLNADKPGLQSYTISLTPLKGEASEQNNTRTLAIEVMDAHQKIAIVAPAAHPDISALRQSIERNPNYEVEVMLEKADPAKLKECSLIVWHNMPNTRMGLNLADYKQIPAIYIVGSQTDIGRFNALHSGLEIMAKARKLDEVTASHNNTFALFTLDNEICSRMEQMPPLTAPFGTYRMAGDMQSLFVAKIGNIASDRPLIAFGQQEGVRHSFVVGEGLWKWRLQSYLMTESHDDFDQLMEKMVVYTSLQANKERLHVTYDHIYQEGTPVVLQAEFYNDNFEPINTPDVRIEISPFADPKDAQRQSAKASAHTQAYDFNRSGTGYALNLGTPQAGHYSFAATTTWNGKKYTTSGAFAVEQINLEQLNLVADHGLLNTLAQTTGGAMLAPDQLDRLPQLLDDRDDLKSIIYTQTRYTELINLPLIFILLILLLGVEWALRKYFFN